MVVREARAAERPGKNHFLLGRRVEAKAIRALNVHASHHTKGSCKMQRNTDAEKLFCFASPDGLSGLLPQVGTLSEE